MKQSLSEMQQLLIKLSVALLAYPIGKIFFFAFNYSYFPDVSLSDFISILFGGLRFDLSALILMNTPFILLHIIPFGFTKKKWYRVILKTVFITVNSIAILADCIDLEYYKFTFKRTTADFFDLFGLGTDITALLPQYIVDFWYIILIWIVITTLIAYLYSLTTSHAPRFSGSNEKNGEWQKRGMVVRLFSWLVLNSVFIGLCIIAFRGGLQLRPIMPINASEYVLAKNIPLIINTPFSIIKSFDLEKLERKKYFTEEELALIFNPIHQKQPSSDTEQRTNVFIIILESFSKEYIGSLSGKQTHTPFLDSLIQQSLVFDNAFANGKKSLEALPAVLAGIPSLMNESYITSTYGSNRFTSVASALKEKGYSTAFFHGGTNGTMGFDVFCNAAGIDSYFGRFEYNNEKDYDGNWGIWDEEFFQYAAKNIIHLKEPFCATFFSLSSHHPYKIPEKYEQYFKENDPILQSIEYADFSLKKFFNSASKEKWFDNTLFIITADHTGPPHDNTYGNAAGMFKIPILFYKRNSAFTGVNHTIAQHIDIMPTLLNYAGYTKDFFALGNNLLDTVHTGYAVNFINEVYQLFQDEYLLQFDGNNALAFYNYQSDSLLQNNLLGKETERQKQMERKLKAIIQIYTDAMINNRLTAEKK